MFNCTTSGGCSPPAGEMIYPASHLHFRDLRAEEVIVRPCETRNNKVKVLLYKDARSDRRILNEAVCEMNWQTDYFEQHGMMFCKVGIRNPETGEWIWKADTGTESNIEAEKGLASDAFKRACFAFGIGESLYSAPDVWISLTDKDMFQGKLCQTFRVSEMTIEDGYITSLTIVDKWENVRYTYSRNDSPVKPAQKEQSPQEELQDRRNETREYVYVQEPFDPELTISPEELEKLCSSETPKELSPNEMLKEFYQRKRTEAGIDERQLNNFFKFFMGPSNKEPGKTVAETWNNFVPEKTWSWWLSKAKN